jgi:hypothetical protein
MEVRMSDTTETKLQAIVDGLKAAIPDARKADKGQVAGGTRVRSAAMDAIKALKGLRQHVLDDRNARKGA